MVLLPFGIAGDEQIVCSFENNFVAFASNCAECTIGVYKIERIVRVVHRLPDRKTRFEHGRDAQIGDQNRQCDGDCVLIRDGSDSAPLVPPAGQFLRQNAANQSVIKAGEEGNDGDVIQKRQLPLMIRMTGS